MKQIYICQHKYVCVYIFICVRVCACNVCMHGNNPKKKQSEIKKIKLNIKIGFVSTNTLRTLTDRQTFSWQIQPSMLKDRQIEKIYIQKLQARQFSIKRLGTQVTSCNPSATKFSNSYVLLTCYIQLQNVENFPTRVLYINKCKFSQAFSATKRSEERREKSEQWRIYAKTGRTYLMGAGQCRPLTTYTAGLASLAPGGPAFSVNDVNYMLVLPP